MPDDGSGPWRCAIAAPLRLPRVRVESCVRVHQRRPGSLNPGTRPLRSSSPQSTSVASARNAPAVACKQVVPPVARHQARRCFSEGGNVLRRGLNLHAELQALRLPVCFSCRSKAGGGSIRECPPLSRALFAKHALGRGMIEQAQRYMAVDLVGFHVRVVEGEVSPPRGWNVEYVVSCAT